MEQLYGPNGEMCCECAKWEDCLVTFTPEWSTMKVIKTSKNEPLLEGKTFKMVKCGEYIKEVV